MFASNNTTIPQIVIYLIRIEILLNVFFFGLFINKNKDINSGISTRIITEYKKIAV